MEPPNRAHRASNVGVLQHILSIHPRPAAAADPRLRADVDVQPPGADDVLFELGAYRVVLLARHGGVHGCDGGRCRTAVR